MVAVQRAPLAVSAPVPRAWSTNAAWRVVIDDGRLLLSVPGEEHVLAERDEIVAARLVPPGADPRLPAGETCLVFVLRDGSQLALPLGSWSLGDFGTTRRVVPPTPGDALEASGLAALVDALGLALDPSGAVSGGAVSVIDPLGGAAGVGPRPLLRRAGPFASVLLGLTLPICGLILQFTHGRVTWPIKTWVIGDLVLMGFVFVLVARALAAASARTRQPVSAVTRVDGLPLPVQLATLADGTLVAVDPSGLETHLPGRRLGGVTRAVQYGPDGPIGLQIDGGLEATPAQVLVLEPTWWHDAPEARDRVCSWLRDSDVDVEVVSMPRPLKRGEDAWVTAREDSRTWDRGLQQQLNAALFLLLAVLVPLAVDLTPICWLAVGLLVGTRAWLLLLRRRDTR